LAGTDESAEERNEQATQQRREDFRKEGQVAQSREVSGILIMFGISVLFYLMSRQFMSEIYDLFTSSFTYYFQMISRGDSDFSPMIKMAGRKALILAGPILLVTFILGAGASILQVGFLTSWEVIAPDLERINPLSGFQRLFRLRSVVEGLKATFKIILIGSVAYMLIRSEVMNAHQMVQFSVPQMLAHISMVTFKLLIGVAVFMAFLALLDYGYQWWDLEKRMRMTKQEIKEEFKQREGDPLIKSLIRRLQRDIANKRMMEKVPKADVVITNPTHIAVAIMYDRQKMMAPIVVAKGADYIAEKIKEIARKHGVPVVENKPLARTLFKTIKLNHPVPRALYTAIAEVLAYVYKLKGKIAGS